MAIKTFIAASCAALFAGGMVYFSAIPSESGGSARIETGQSSSKESTSKDIMSRYIGAKEKDSEDSVSSGEDAVSSEKDMESAETADGEAEVTEVAELETDSEANPYVLESEPVLPMEKDLEKDDFPEDAPQISEPMMEKPMMEKPMMEESVMEKPMMEESMMEKPVMEQEAELETDREVKIKPFEPVTLEEENPYEVETDPSYVAEAELGSDKMSDPEIIEIDPESSLPPMPEAEDVEAEELKADRNQQSIDRKERREARKERMQRRAEWRKKHRMDPDFSMDPAQKRIETVFRQAENITQPDLRDRAYLDLAEYATVKGLFDEAKTAAKKIEQVELRDTARSRIAMGLARLGKSDEAFALIEEVEVTELRDVMRLQVIEALLGTDTRR